MTRQGGMKAMLFILATATFERMAMFGLLVNFLVYLTRELHMNQVSAAILMSILNGATNFGPIIGAVISDAHLGRFKTIAIASISSLLGMTVVTLTTWVPQLHPAPCMHEQHALNQCQSATKTHLSTLFAGLLLLSIGTSGIQSCCIPFGIDQFDKTTVDGQRGIKSFFNWYYATLSLGLLLGQSVIVYIQDSKSWKVGFGIPTLFMALSIVIFFMGSGTYVHVEPQGNIFSKIAKVLVAAYKKRELDLPSADVIDPQEQQTNESGIIVYHPPAQIIDDSAGGAAPDLCTMRLRLTNEFRALNKACVVREAELNLDGSRANAWRLSSVQEVEELKCVARILWIWATNIFTTIAMLQSSTFFVSQALQMNRNLGPHFQIPAGSIQLFTSLTLILWVPLYNRLLIPTLRSLMHRDSPISLLRRIGTGMAFSPLSMLVAALIEQYRRATAATHPNMHGVAPTSFLWLIPQLVLLGLYESVNIIGQLEFYNTQFPDHMRSMGNVLLLSSIGVAGYINGLMMMVIHSTTRSKGRVDWLGNDLNKGKLDYFYLLLLGIGVANMGIFVLVARKYKYRESLEVVNHIPTPHSI